MAILSGLPGQRHTLPSNCLQCQSCGGITLSDQASHRDHFRSDWHRYNLKRKLVGLAPVSDEEFSLRSSEFAESTRTDPLAKPAKHRDTAIICSQCNKRFPNQKGYENHIRSGKHPSLLPAFDELLPPEVQDFLKKSRQSQQENDSLNGEFLELREKLESALSSGDQESIEEICLQVKMKTHPVSALKCLFCDEQFEDLPNNIEHMVLAHSFFVPDMEYLIDLNGLILYLASIIEHFNLCLTCLDRGRGFRSPAAARHHMIDKGHTKICYDILEREGFDEEFSTFFDYDASDWSDLDEEEDQHQPNDDKRHHSNEFIDIQEDENIAGIRSASSSTPFSDDSELTLPSGKRIGNRTYHRYYKQYLTPTRFEDEDDELRLLKASEDPSEEGTLRLPPRGRSCNLTSRTMTNIPASDVIHVDEEKSRSVYNVPSNFSRAAITKAEVKSQRKICIKIAKQMLAVGSKANLLQPHFREQIL